MSFIDQSVTVFVIYLKKVSDLKKCKQTTSFEQEHDTRKVD